jgi:hypothetical protein
MLVKRLIIHALAFFSINSYGQELCPQPTDLITNDIVDNGGFVHVNSTGNIETSDKISGNSHVTYVAGNIISFKPGFHAEYGVQVRTGITKCESEDIIESLPRGPYGGGRGYEALINTEGFHPVKSWKEFEKAVEVDGYTEILIDGPFEIEEDTILIEKPNTIIAGLRGQSANNPSVMEQTIYRPNNQGMIRVHESAENVRITGIELKGFWKLFEGVYSDELELWQIITNGIVIDNVIDVEIDNCFISQWCGSGVSIGGNKTGQNINVHHNVFTKNNSPQWPTNSNGEIVASNGYGVSLGGSNTMATIVFNLFENNKHAIAGGSSGGESYIATFNAVRHDIQDYRHAFDMHGCMDTDKRNTGGCLWPNWNYSGDEIVIENNFFEKADYGQWAIGIRGVPFTAGYIRNNYFETNASNERVIQNLGDLNGDGILSWDGVEVRHEGLGSFANLYTAGNVNNGND